VESSAQRRISGALLKEIEIVQLDVVGTIARRHICLSVAERLTQMVVQFHWDSRRP
jgi:hypothetical protein